MVAYRIIALDFDLWCRTQKEIQRMHLEHFNTLLHLSRHKKFNARQRFAKLGVVRKLLFVLQIGWYQPDMTPFVIGALKATAEANFSADDAIKPLVSYLAAYLHEGRIHEQSRNLFVENVCIVGTPTADSPRSTSSQLSRANLKHPHETAEQVLEALTSILMSPAMYNKFTTTLPLSRICLLLLGDPTSSVVASQVLLLINISLSASQSFSRKFELVSGWSALKASLPGAWDPGVHEAAFDILLGRLRINNNNTVRGGSSEVACPHILPAILSALRKGLITIAKYAALADAGDGKYLLMYRAPP
jgi:hypothetical protein